MTFNNSAAGVCLRLIFLSLLCSSHAALGQTPSKPSETDLHSAYCVTTLQWQLEMATTYLQGAENFETNATSPQMREQSAKIKTAAMEQIARLKSALNRLQANLAPKVPKLDPAAMQTAQQSADTDIQSMQTSSASCPSHCAESANMTSCLESCGNKDGSMSRMKACWNPAWLPRQVESTTK